MRVLLTGGAGYIGSHTAKLLTLQGHEVVVYDNLSRGNLWAVRWGVFERGDISDRASLGSLFSRYHFDAVIHFAAYAYVAESMTLPGAYFQNNVGGTFTLLEAMLSAGIQKLVFSSSCAVYGVPGALPITESHPIQPCSPYGETKAAVERSLPWWAAAYGLQWVALRYFNAAGCDPGGEIGEFHNPETHLIPLLLDAASYEGEPCTVFGDNYPTQDGTCIRDFVHVADLAQAHLASVEYLDGGGSNRAINLGTGQGHSIREIIGHVARVSGNAPKVVFGPRRPGDPPALYADSRLARDVLGWRASHSSIEEIVETAWNWHQKKVHKLVGC